MQAAYYDPSIEQQMGPQALKVFQYMRSGKGISRVIADASLGVASVSRRICDLEALGVPIERSTRTEAHSGRRYVVYKIEDTRGWVDRG